MNIFQKVSTSDTLLRIRLKAHCQTAIYIPYL